MMSKKIQFNIWIPPEWKEQLKRIARYKSMEEDRTITHVDLVVGAIRDILEKNKDIGAGKTSKTTVMLHTEADHEISGYE